MNQFKQAFLLFCLPVILLASIAVSAQTDGDRINQPEQSYEIALHIIIGSTDNGLGAPLPSNLSAVSKHIKGTFAYPNYRLTNTLLVRTGTNNGTLEHKGVTNILGLEGDAETQSFLEWQMSTIRLAPGGLQARPFRFGARIPVRMPIMKEGTSPASSVVAYEQIALNVGSISFPMNTPTLVGTISLPRTMGTMFIVATVRNPEM
jgi:hypothetical protein